jgi:hypothetical protein
MRIGVNTGESSVRIGDEPIVPPVWHGAQVHSVCRLPSSTLHHHIKFRFGDRTALSRPHVRGATITAPAGSASESDRLPLRIFECAARVESHNVW